MTRTGLLTITVLLMAAAGCTSGGTANPPAANPPAVSPSSTGTAPASSTTAAVPPSGNFEAQSLAVGRQFARCARDHGDATFPDPLFDNGYLTYPNVAKQRIEAAEGSCAQILRQLATVPQQTDPPSAATLEHMRQFAQCMRVHGVPNFPDPKNDGTFPLLGTPFAGLARYAGPGAPQQLIDARMACIEHEQEWRLAAS